MRISKQMMEILNVLYMEQGPIKLTQIILRAKKLKPIRRKKTYSDGETIEIHPVQLELASALAGESFSWYMGGPPFTSRYVQPFRKEAAKLYISFGRSIKTLTMLGLVLAVVDKARARQFSYVLTDEGRKYVERNHATTGNHDD
jgi:hypothetical protein